MVIERSSKKIICVHVADGRRHDFRMFKESRLPILQQTKVQADSGYQGIQKRHSNSEIPKKGSKKKPLTKADKKANRKLSASRVLVENVLRTLKIFRILAEKYRNRRRRFGLRLNLIAAIINLQLG